MNAENNIDRQTVQIYLFYGGQCDNGDEWPPKCAEQFMAWFMNLLVQIPKEYIDSATIRIGDESYYDSSYPTLEVAYWRPETDEEVAERLDRVKADAEQRKAEDLRKLAKLKALYG